jgi:hypothetical protein
MLPGVMREAEVIPSSGDPLADLLVAFVPYTVAAFTSAEAMSLKKLKQSIGTSSDLQSRGHPTTIH